MDFASRRCVPCEGSSEPLTAEKVGEYLAVVPGWQAGNSVKIYREFICRDFVSAIELINGVAALAESEGHHPDLALSSWNHLKVTLWTHAIGGLSENDFILAAKTNAFVASKPELLKAT